MFRRWAYLDDNERVNAMCENKTSLYESFLENIRPGELSGFGFGGGDAEARCIERICQGIRRYASGGKDVHIYDRSGGIQHRAAITALPDGARIRLDETKIDDIQRGIIDSAKEGSLSLVVINYLQLIESDVPRTTMFETMTHKVERLRATAESTQIPILVAHHMPRRTEGLRVSCMGDCFSQEWQIVNDGDGLKERFTGRGHPFEVM